MYLLVFHMFSALAEFERSLIRERTRAELAAAKRIGRTGGRPPKMTDDDIEAARALLANPDNDADRAPPWRLSRDALSLYSCRADGECVSHLRRLSKSNFIRGSSGQRRASANQYLCIENLRSTSSR
jgi:resolvase-like protein